MLRHQTMKTANLVTRGLQVRTVARVAPRPIEQNPLPPNTSARATTGSETASDVAVRTKQQVVDGGRIVKGHHAAAATATAAGWQQRAASTMTYVDPNGSMATEIESIGSSTATSNNTVVARRAVNADEKVEKDELDMTFSNTRVAYKSKTLRDLARNYLVLGLCSSSFLVQNNERLMKISRKLLGKRGFDFVMRSTFYGQFVAGADEKEIVPVIKHLSSFGVKTMLDYGAEEDVSESSVKQELKADSSKNSVQLNYLGNSGDKYQVSAKFADRRKYLPVARTYLYHGESQCERNLEMFFKAIDAVADATDNMGMAAIKMTALGKPRLLMKLSQIIDYMRQIEGSEWFAQQHDGIDGVLQRFNALKQTDISPLDEDEQEMLANLMRRVNRLATYASQVGGVRCMMDAEQSYMQSAINLVTMEMMRKYNMREPIIYSTYQCYRKDALEQVKRDLAIARRENFYFGAKLVRGAYMEQERARAAELGYEDPINESYEATSCMYEKTLSYLMGEMEREIKFEKCSKQQQDLVITNPMNRNRRIAIMVASHNEDTVRFTLEQMKARGIEPEHRVICFGQLYGMCDHVSFMLGQAGYSVYKYAPYGPLEEVLPYLGRRAIENHGFMNSSKRERGLLAKEILKRMATLRWFYKPEGKYRPIVS